MTSPDPIQTSSLTLVLKTPEEARSLIETLSPEHRSQVSPVWLARVASAVAPDPWIHGYKVIQRSSGGVVGSAGFKAPPADGMVEIAYVIEPEHLGKGYATEAAAALTAFALSQPEVTVVRAHTLPESNASTRVLAKCGFKKIGEVDDPEDGRVWRWEMKRAADPIANFYRRNAGEVKRERSHPATVYEKGQYLLELRQRALSTPQTVAVIVIATVIMVLVAYTAIAILR